MQSFPRHYWWCTNNLRQHIHKNIEGDQAIWSHQWPTTSQKNHTHQRFMRDNPRVIIFFCDNKMVDSQPKELLSPLRARPIYIPAYYITDRSIWKPVIFFFFICLICVLFFNCFWTWFWQKMVMVNWLPYYLYDKYYLSFLL